MGKRLSPSISCRYLEVAAIRGSTVCKKGKKYPFLHFYHTQQHNLIQKGEFYRENRENFSLNSRISARFSLKRANIFPVFGRAEFIPHPRGGCILVVYIVLGCF